MSQKKIVIICLLFVSFASLCASVKINLNGSMASCVQYVGYKESENIVFGSEVAVCPEFHFGNFSFGPVIYAGDYNTVIFSDPYRNPGRVSCAGCGLECNYLISKLIIGVDLSAKFTLFQQEYGGLYSSIDVSVFMGFSIIKNEDMVLNLFVPLSFGFSAYSKSVKAGIGISLGTGI